MKRNLNDHGEDLSKVRTILVEPASTKQDGMVEALNEGMTQFDQKGSYTKLLHWS